jgi:hypothetical protein
MLQLEIILVICPRNVSGIAWAFVVAISCLRRLRTISTDVSSREISSRSWRAARQSLTKEAIRNDVLAISEIRVRHLVAIDRGSISRLPDGRVRHSRSGCDFP